MKRDGRRIFKGVPTNGPGKEKCVAAMARFFGAEPKQGRWVGTLGDPGGRGADYLRHVGQAAALGFHAPAIVFAEIETKTARAIRSCGRRLGSPAEAYQGDVFAVALGIDDVAFLDFDLTEHISESLIRKVARTVVATGATYFTLTFTQKGNEKVMRDIDEWGSRLGVPPTQNSKSKTRSWRKKEGQHRDNDRRPHASQHSIARIAFARALPGWEFEDVGYLGTRSVKPGRRRSGTPMICVLGKLAKPGV